MRKPVDAKINFAAVPARTIGDKSLTAEELRVLMAIAAHDRFGANGIGCYASHPRLSGLANCHLKSLSRSLRMLAERGYITADVHPLNRKQRVYKVVYSEEDALFMKSCRPEKGNETATYSKPLGNGVATNNVPVGNKSDPNDAGIGNKGSKKALPDQLVEKPNIFCEAEKKSSQTDNINSEGSAASLQRTLQTWTETDTGKVLGTIEQAIKSNSIAPSDIDSCFRVLEGIMGAYEYGAPLYGWAYRLNEELGSLAEE
ncbi:helix-turn-helix domain-containing protein [Phyllobacterium sp. 22552]|uniref:helix-turn-helix domain-containing protein n=1 Tax=Phyllobacterium sp. 22552 TaxID=3453941 RepID=UPI003F87CB78